MYVGRRIGNYVIQSELGAGGMGTVYLAQHAVIGRKAAIKILKRELTGDEVTVARFVNEARATNLIGHPGIVDVLDVGTLPEGVPFLVMEYLQGESLARRLERVGRVGTTDAGGDRLRDRLGPGRGPRQGHRPPRSQARQPLPGARPKAPAASR
jgi:serine/threonine-protein kinase